MFMDKQAIFGRIMLIFIALALVSCKGEFEKIRTSQDPKLVLQKADEYFEEENWYRAQVLYELVINQVRGTAQAENVFYKYAYTHFHLKQYQLAAHYFDNFSRTFVASPQREEADFMVAFSNYKESPSYRLDQTPTKNAIDRFQVFMNQYPTSSRVPICNGYIDELRKKLEAKAFHQGELYYNLRQFDAATRTFENLLKEFPDSNDEEEVRFLILKSSFLLAQNSIYEKKEERFLNTIDNFKNFRTKHPKSKYSKEAENIVATSKKRLKEFQ